MVLELESIRKVFPDWPSELDAAKCETNWASNRSVKPVVNFFVPLSLVEL